MTRWQDEVKSLIEGGWEPVIKSGEFSVQAIREGFVISVSPPQGIYACWTGVVRRQDGSFVASVRGETASLVLAEISRRISE